MYICAVSNKIKYSCDVYKFNDGQKFNYWIYFAMDNVRNYQWSVVWDHWKFNQITNEKNLMVCRRSNFFSFLGK